MSSSGGRSQSVDTIDGWSGTRTAEVVGITYRQLDYWARTDLVRPDITDAKGSGTRRMYSYQNLLELKIIKQLLDAGAEWFVTMVKLWTRNSMNNAQSKYTLYCAVFPVIHCQFLLFASFVLRSADE